MRVSGLTISRYRVFRERRKLALAPITLIIGKNGSGKSVLSRLPLLLANAVSKEPSGPLDLVAGGVDHAASYQDLVNMRGALPFSVGADISGNGQQIEFETTLRYVSETRSLAIERFELQKDGVSKVIIEISKAEELISKAPTYKIIGLGKTERDIVLTFNGLFPEVDDNELGSVLAEARSQFQASFAMPAYLGPFRAEPVREMRQPNQNIRDLGPRGERSLELLADDRLRHGGKLSAAVSDWFSKSMGFGISVNVAGEQPQVLVRDGRSNLEVSLSDTGAGFSQAIPVVVQNLAFQLGRLPASMLIVEQPELHLHPAAHGDLADLIIASSQHEPNATCIVETHSEQFIMRVRRRIAEGLNPANVVLWSLDHRDGIDAEPESLRVIHFDAEGNPASWPVGVFEESLADLTEMRRSGRARSR